MDFYEFTLKLKQELQEEADKIALRNGHGNATSFEEYKGIAGRIVGIETAITKIGEITKKILGEAGDLDEDQDSDR